MTGGRVLAVLAFYVAALDLARGEGLVGAVASPPGIALLALAAALFAWSAVRLLRGRDVPAPRRAARALAAAGAALVLVAVPASLVLRDVRTVSVGEGEDLPAEGGLPAVHVGEIRLAPRGPHLLSKTVDVELQPENEDPVTVGLLPPTSVAGRRWSVFRFGYAPGFSLVDDRGRTVAAGFVKLGTLPQTEEDARLVQWTPETNLMMGAGTFPPRLEDLVSPPGSGWHVFLRVVRARLGSATRDLTEPDAYRWLLDGHPEQPVFFAQVFRGRERVFDGLVRGGETVRFAGGSLALAPELRLWVDLVATRDPWMPVAVAGLGMLAAGAALSAALALRRVTRRRRAPAPPAPPRAAA